MKLPSFFIYLTVPTWRISFVYVFSLMWLRELSSNPIFYGATAKASLILWFGRQVSRSPQKTCDDQTSIIGRFLCSGVSAKIDGKFPLPSSMNTPTGTEPPSPPAISIAKNQGSRRPCGGHPHPHPQIPHSREAWVWTPSTVFTGHGCINRTDLHCHIILTSERGGFSSGKTDSTKWEDDFEVEVQRYVAPLFSARNPALRKNPGDVYTTTIGLDKHEAAYPPLV
jgi:hypothetical protein